MFSQLAKLLEGDGENDVLVLTFARPAGNTHRLTVVHQTDGGRKPAFQPIVMEGVAEEFDAPDISFEPIVEARKSVKEAIAAAAEATKAKAKPAATAPKPAAAPATKKAGEKGKPQPTQPKGQPTQTSLPSADPEAEAERMRVEQQKKADGEIAKAEAKKKKEDEAKAAAEAKAARDQEIKELQEKLKTLKGGK